MKLSIFLTLAFAFHAFAETKAQKITLSVTNVPLREVMQEVQKQQGLSFLFRGDDVADTRISAHLDQVDFSAAMGIILTNHGLDWSLDNGIITIKPSLEILPNEQPTAVRQRTITGRVTDEQGNPLEGVTVRVKGTGIATTTGADGQYELDASDEDNTFVYSIVGFESTELNIRGRSSIHVSLKTLVSDLDEVVVVGYGSAKRKDLTGAITRIDASDFETRAANSVTEFLTGTTPGVQVAQSGSAQGGTGSLEIRGVNSLRASTAPLVVVDGAIFNGDLFDINPNDIETVDILQDASAAAVYGARAANGVIIISTKRGKGDQPTVQVTAVSGIANTTNDYRPFNADEYLGFRKELLRLIAPRDDAAYKGYYDDPRSLPEDVEIEDWRNYSDNPNSDDVVEWLSRLRLNDTEVANYLSGKTIDWYNKRMQTGVRQDYNLSLSANPKLINYYLSTGYTDNKGMVFGDRYKTWRTRANIESKIADFLTIGLNSQFSAIDAGSVTADGINAMSPYGTFEREDGMLQRYPQDDVQFPNPFLDAYYQDQFVKRNNLFATFYSEVRLPFGFKYRISFQNRLVSGKSYNFWPTSTMNGGIWHENGYGTREDSHQYEWMVDNILSWNKTFGDHTFDFTFLANAEKLQTRKSSLANENFEMSEVLGWSGLQYGTNPSISSNDETATADALMFRLNYSLLDRYMATLSWRRDGFSAFGQNHPRGVFPAVAFAWRLSNEPFFQLDQIDDLKLRFSWGINGNRSVGRYAALANLSRNVYFDGENVVVGVTNTKMANPNLKWEGTEAYNIGLDLTAFSNRFTLSADIYKGSTKDLLIDRSLPEIMGYQSVVTNLGMVSNKGINVSMTGQPIRTAVFSWKSNLVFSLNRNRIDKLWGDFTEETVNGRTVRTEVPDYANGWFPGQAIDRIWNYRIIGIWQEEEAEEAAKYGLRPGDFKAADVNEDGTYSQFDDKQFLGWTQPRFTLGLRNDFGFFRNFELSMFWRADLGHLGARGDFNHGQSHMYDRSNAIGVPYWTPENRSNEYPRLNVNTDLYEGGINRYESRSFVRLQDLSLRYQFGSRALQSMTLDRMSVYVSARNLLTFSSWSGWDPESGNSPMSRIWTLGLNVSL